jgi:hypothetical protein
MIARRRAASEPSFDSRSASTRIKSASSSRTSSAEQFPHNGSFRQGLSIMLRLLRPYFQRLTAIDLKNLTVTLSILDGVQGGRQYFYHLVTDASAAVPAVIEKGVFAPRLAMIPAFGQSSSPSENSALLGFSPVLNGRTDKGAGEDQGFSTALANGGIDPINVFPIGPENDDVSASNNYSPLWDSHVSMWTAAAIRAGKVHRIHSMNEQKTFIREGLLTSAEIDPAGPGNPYVGASVRPGRSSIVRSSPIPSYRRSNAPRQQSSPRRCSAIARAGSRYLRRGTRRRPGVALHGLREGVPPATRIDAPPHGPDRLSAPRKAP